MWGEYITSNSFQSIVTPPSKKKHKMKIADTLIADMEIKFRKTIATIAS